MLRALFPLALALAGCTKGGTDDSAPDSATDSAEPTDPCEEVPAPCVFVDPADTESDLYDVVNALADNTTVLLGAGTFVLNNEVTINGVSGISVIGAGMDETLLDFSSMEIQGNGVFAVGDDFLIQDLTVTDAPKDGIRVEDSDGVTFRRVRATWAGGPDTSNGAYGLYPVRVQNVIIEDSEALNASDAGIYVGQCTNALVRNNLATGNVAGIEIENTQYADVYGNVAEDNTGGLVIFDLPGNPIVGHDVYVHDNIVRNNNRKNFAPGGTVRMIPAGTGTFAMASRRVEITGNTYENNGTVDIAILSGMVVDDDPSAWAIPADEVVGDAGVLEYDQDGDTIYNFRTHDVYVHGNSHSGSGSAPDTSREFGQLVAIIYQGDPGDNVLYDGIGESSVDPEVAANNSNDNVVCVGADEGSFINVNLEVLDGVPSMDDMYRPPPPFTPFDCSALTGGPIQTPDLE